MAKTLAGTFFVLVAIILIVNYGEGGTYAVRSWFSAKLFNKPFDPPRRAARVRAA